MSSFLIVFRSAYENYLGVLIFPSAFHPQTQGQIKVVNGSLENLLKCLVGKN